MSSAICFNLDQSNILSSGNGLREICYFDFIRFTGYLIYWCVKVCFVIFQSKDITFRGHGDSVDQLCWHPKNPDQLVTASGDKTIRLWDARTNKSVATVNTKGKQKLKKYFMSQPFTKQQNFGLDQNESICRHKI